LREHLIEVHGEQHYELSLLGDKVRESDRLKKEWAAYQEIPLLVLSHSEVCALYLDEPDELVARISEFLGIQK